MGTEHFDNGLINSGKTFFKIIFEYATFGYINNYVKGFMEEKTICFYSGVVKQSRGSSRIDGQ